MLLTSLTVLLPVLFVVALGYWAGRAKKFDADQVQGINELVLDYALPAIMFVSITKTTRSEMLAEVPFLISLLVAFLGFFLIVFCISFFLLHHSLGEAALQANLVSLPSVAFMGIPIFRGLFGEQGVLSITTASVLALVTVAPLTVVLLEVHGQRSGNHAPRVSALVVGALESSFKKPMVWAPLLATVLVLFDVRVPDEIDAMLTLIGSATSGASLFVAGLIISAYEIKLNFEVIANVVGKMVAQPAFMVLLIALFGVQEPFAREAILICAIPTAVLAPLLAPRYRTYESEAASTLVLTMLAMVVTFPLAIVLTGG